MSWRAKLLDLLRGGDPDLEEGEEAADVVDAVEVDARLCVWRVFGVSRDFSDRPPDAPAWTTTVDAGASEGDQLTLTVGEIPSVMVEAARSASALARYSLVTMFGGEHAGKSTAEMAQVLDDLYDESADVEKEIRGTFPLWVTLEVARPLLLLGDPDAKYQWVRDPVVTPELLDEFAQEASEFLDVAVARILPALGDQLGLDRLLFSRRRAYLVASGKAAIAMPAFKMSANGVSVKTGGWDDLPYEAMTGSLAALKDRNPQTDKLVRAASRWLQAAMAESDDPLRRFLFAFFGLEILANKVGKRVEAAVVADLSNELLLPVEHLVWPAPKDADSPWRNLTFRFSMLAVRVARDVGGRNGVQGTRGVAEQALPRKRYRRRRRRTTGVESDSPPPSIHLARDGSGHGRGAVTSSGFADDTAGVDEPHFDP